MFFSLKSVLERSLRQKGISEAVRAEQVVGAFRAVVADLLGQAVADNLRQVALKGEVLQVSAGSSVLASELRLRQEELIKALSNRIEGKLYRLQIFG